LKGLDADDADFTADDSVVSFTRPVPMKALQWSRLARARRVGAATDEWLFERWPVPMAEVE
jgi:hypothetical protein